MRGLLTRGTTVVHEYFIDLLSLFVVATDSVHYSGPPLIRPPLNNRKSGHIRDVAFREGDKMV